MWCEGLCFSEAFAPPGRRNGRSASHPGGKHWTEMCMVLSLAVLLSIQVRSRKSRRRPMNSTGHDPRILFFFLFFNLRSAASGCQCRCCDLRVSARLHHGTVKTMDYFFMFFFVYFQVIIPPLTNHTTMLNLSLRLQRFCRKTFGFPFL